MDTQQLITLLQSGDNTPLKFLFEQYGGYCQRLLQQRTGCNSEEASDVFTDALLVFRRNVIEEKIVAVSHPKTYLYTICYYLYRAGQQQQQRKTVQQGEVHEALYGDQNEPEHEALDREVALPQKQQTVSTAFYRLSPRCREVLYHFYVDRWSIKKIAKQMNRTAESVKTARYRCFEQWKNFIEDQSLK